MLNKFFSILLVAAGSACFAQAATAQLPQAGVELVESDLKSHMETICRFHASRLENQLKVALSDASHRGQKECTEQFAKSSEVLIREVIDDLMQMDASEIGKKARFWNLGQRVMREQIYAVIDDSVNEEWSEKQVLALKSQTSLKIHDLIETHIAMRETPKVTYTYR